MTVNPVCKTCANYLMGRTCLAFPIKIPDKVWYNKDDHKNKITGDNGIQYEPMQDILPSKIR